MGGGFNFSQDQIRGFFDSMRTAREGNRLVLGRLMSQIPEDSPIRTQPLNTGGQLRGPTGAATPFRRQPMIPTQPVAAPVAPVPRRERVTNFPVAASIGPNGFTRVPPRENQPTSNTVGPALANPLITNRRK